MQLPAPYHQYQVKVYPTGDGTFTAACDELGEDCTVLGRTRGEALENMLLVLENMSTVERKETDA